MIQQNEQLSDTNLLYKEAHTHYILVNYWENSTDVDNASGCPTNSIVKSPYSDWSSGEDLSLP